MPPATPLKHETVILKVQMWSSMIQLCRIHRELRTFRHPKVPVAGCPPCICPRVK